jgi:hypothetical protein
MDLGGSSYKHHAQLAYFIYRSLDCFPVLLYGAGEQPSLMDSSARAVARLLKLLLSHGDQLPEPGEVHIATEALTTQLFYFAVTKRQAYVALLRLAYDLAFRGIHGYDETRGIKSAFERLLDDVSGAFPPSLVERSREELQVRELAKLVRDAVYVAHPF